MRLCGGKRCPALKKEEEEAVCAKAITIFGNGSFAPSVHLRSARIDRYVDTRMSRYLPNYRSQTTLFCVRRRPKPKWLRLYLFVRRNYCHSILFHGVQGSAVFSVVKANTVNLRRSIDLYTLKRRSRRRSGKFGTRDDDVDDHHVRQPVFLGIRAINSDPNHAFMSTN